MDEDFLRGNATQESMGTPQPVAKQTCGLDWEKHPKNPTLEHCVKLLKEALAVQSANARKPSAASAPTTSRPAS